MKVLISGSSGFVGKALCQALQHEGHTVLRLVRSALAPTTPDAILWDPVAGTLDTDALNRLAPPDAPLDAVIHLAGESVLGLWSKRKKAAIRSSRLAGTRLLVNTLAALPVKPHTFINASAIGYYGHRADDVLTELSPPAAAVDRQKRVSPMPLLDPAWGTAFLSHVCIDNEANAQALLDAGVRVVNLRMGMVLGAQGGALKAMAPAFRLGVAGPLGLSGDQFISWISLRDLTGAIQFVLNTPSVRGPVNAVAPEPVINRDFSAALSRHAFWCKPLAGLANRVALPAPLLRLMLGEFGNALLLASARVQPVQLQEAGFTFEHPALDQALSAALSAPATPQR